MDEKKFPRGWGDAQYLARMRKAGWRLLVEPRALVWCEPNTYPKPLHKQSVKEVLKILFVNERHPLNLKRQFVARWESAPTKWQAALAFGVYCFRLGLKTIGIGSWPNWSDPKQDWTLTKSHEVAKFNSLGQSAATPQVDKNEHSSPERAK
jgi:hypothetical protein